jgi:hypothetical protein
MPGVWHDRDPMNLQQVYEITVFVGTQAQGAPNRIVIIYFSDAKHAR